MTYTSCNPLATFANNTPFYATSTSRLGSLHGVISLANRTVSVRDVNIVSDTFRVSGTKFMASIATRRRTSKQGMKARINRDEQNGYNTSMVFDAGADLKCRIDTPCTQKSYS